MNEFRFRELTYEALKSKNETGTGTLSLKSREDSSEGVKRDYFFYNPSISPTELTKQDSKELTETEVTISEPFMVLTLVL